MLRSQALHLLSFAHLQASFYSLLCISLLSEVALNSVYILGRPSTCGSSASTSQAAGIIGPVIPGPTQWSLLERHLASPMYPKMSQARSRSSLHSAANSHLLMDLGSLVPGCMLRYAGLNDPFGLCLRVFDYLVLHSSVDGPLEGLAVRQIPDKQRDGKKGHRKIIEWQSSKIILPYPPDLRQKPCCLKQRPGRLFFSHNKAKLLVDHPTNSRLNKDTFTPKFWAY